MLLKRSTFPTACSVARLRTACSVCVLTAMLAAGGAQAADQGARHHAQGEYDTATATYMVIAGTT